jgi:hypothetical protein
VYPEEEGFFLGRNTVHTDQLLARIEVVINPAHRECWVITTISTAVAAYVALSVLFAVPTVEHV